jgi:hypothetical protein
VLYYHLLLARFEPRKQQVVIEHPALRPQRSKNAGDVNWGRGRRDEGEIGGDARVVHGEDIEATESA